MRQGLSTAVHTSSPVIKEYETLQCAFHKPAMTQPLVSQSVRQTDNQSLRQTDGQTDSQSDIQTVSQTYIQTDSQSVSQTDRQPVSPVQSSTFKAILPYLSLPISLFSLYVLTLSFKCISLTNQFDLAVVIFHKEFKTSHYFTLHILMLISFMLKSSLQQPVFNFKLCSLFQVTDKVFYQHCM